MSTAPGPGDASIAIASLLAGVGTGGALLALTVLAVRGAQAAAPPSAGASAVGATPLAVGSVAALAVAAAVAFARAHPLGTRWQRVAVAAIAAFGTVVPGLIAMPLDRAFGRPGLILIAAISVALAIGGWRAGRGRSGVTP